MSCAWSSRVDEVAGAGDVAADGAVEVSEVERGGVVGDGGAEHGDVGGGAGGGLERIGGVGEYEVDALGHEAVYYSGAAGLLSARVLLTEDHAVLAENLDEARP